MKIIDMIAVVVGYFSSASNIIVGYDQKHILLVYSGIIIFCFASLYFLEVRKNKSFNKE